ncbi:MAG: hypothetical protein GY822_20335 [Deltaproteobacteria bacterium]|nr:hypothetical protein [Deltaproteobacteria bacterium]
MNSSTPDAAEPENPLRPLPLYGFLQCPFTAKVLRYAKRLGVELELRDPRANEKHRVDLRAATGATQSPVLRISDEKWLAESADIITYLEKQVGYVRPAWIAPLSLALSLSVVVLGGLSLMSEEYGRPLAIAAVVVLVLWRGSRR